MPYYARLTISAGNDFWNQCALLCLSSISQASNDIRNLMCLIMLVLPYRLVMTSGINVPYYACLTISRASNDIRNLICLIMLVLPYRLVMTSRINVPYYACLTISAGNDFWNQCALLCLSYHIGW
jgi:hypothetical protein